MEQLSFISSNVDPLWCSWFTGFLDGEGYFQISPQPKSKTAFQICLTITLREDDKYIIEEIKSTLECGRIYYISYKHERVKGHHACNQWRWTVRDISSIVQIIIPLLDHYPLRTKKAHDYVIWRKAALIKSSKAHGNCPEIEDLRKQLKVIHQTPFYEMGYSVSNII
jgi:hypothetical protein